jgi:hypothetical protein
LKTQAKRFFFETEAKRLFFETEAKRLFFEKKNQKTFTRWRQTVRRGSRSIDHAHPVL